MKKLLSIDDLINFCESRQMFKFDSKETGYQICVQTPATFEKSDEEEQPSMLYGKVKIFHTGTNRNQSSVTKEAAEKAMKSIAYKPLLANFVEVDGVKDFTSHDMGINDDGEIEYYEHQIGCFTSDKPTMEYDEEKDRYYVYANVAIPREYTAAAEIIERKNGTKVSAELAVNSMSYDIKEKVLVLEDIEMLGCTCLGIREDGTEVAEGMEGARLDIADFSRDKNSVKFDTNEKLIETLERLNTTLSRLDIDTTGKEENTVPEEIVMEVTNENEVAEETSEVVDMEEAEVAAETEEVTEETTEGEVTEVEDTTETEETPEEDVVDNFNLKRVVECGDQKYEFSTSLSEQMYAMWSLVNETYADSDNEYYDVDIFPDENYVHMYGLYNGRSYRQSFKCKKKKCSLVGDRIEIYRQYLTEDEITALENMKSNYSANEEKLSEVSAKLSKYEEEPEKMNILESADYSQIANTEEFVAFKEKDAHFDMSVEEVRAKADEMLLAFAKNNKLEFASTENKIEIGKKVMPIDKKNTERRGRYGGMFNKKED